MTSTSASDHDRTEADIDKAVEEDLIALYARQTSRTWPPIVLTAILIAAAAWPRAPHAMIIALIAADWTTLSIRHFGLTALPSWKLGPRQRLKMAALLRGMHGLTSAALVLLFPYLTDLGKTVLTLILAGLTTGAIGTSGGCLLVYMAYAGPVMGALMLGWAFTPFQGDDEWMATAMVPLIGMFLLVMMGLTRDNFRSFRNSIAKRIEEERLNAQLRTALDVAESANAAKTRFLASASHDLRQPLHSLSLFFATLRLQTTDQPHKVLLDHIDQALSALQSQMNALLDMSKLDAGMVQITLRPVALGPLLAQLLDAYRLDAQRKNIHLAIRGDPDLVVQSDPDQLGRVLRNVLDNAIKYTAQGEITADIQVRSDRIEVSIEDSGCGIPEYLHSQVFDEFFQVDNPERDRSRGLGLGLSIVKRLAALLDIRIALTSTPGLGTQLRLSIPQALEALEPRISANIRNAQASMPMCHVLVIDDEAAVRTGMALLLRGMGCEVSLASGIADALEQASRQAPDLVLADLRLRDKDTGIQAIARLREQHPGLPALIVTGDTAPDRLKQTRAAGLTVLHKPVAAKDLIEAIADSLDRA